MDPKDSKTLASVAGSDSMRAPPPQGSSASPRWSMPPVPQSSSSRGQGNTNSMRDQPGQNGVPARKKRHRAGKKRRTRRESFIAPSETTVAELDDDEDDDRRPSMLDTSRPSATKASFYRLKTGGRSETSLESEALLDHREQQSFRSRRQSINQSMYNARQSMPFSRAHRQSQTSGFTPSSPLRAKAQRSRTASISEDDEEHNTSERTPLVTSAKHISAKRERPGDRERPETSRTGSNYGVFASQHHDRTRRRSSASNKRAGSDDEDFDVNNPPSVPGSPKMGSLDDVMIAEEFSHGNGRSPAPRDAIIDIDRRDSIDRSDHNSDRFGRSAPSSLGNGSRRRTLHDLAQNDVCYPADAGDEEFSQTRGRRSPRRRRHRRWPDLGVLDEWSREEKEERNMENTRAKKITEPVMVGGRLRPTKTVWHREEDEIPYRYTYFNEAFDATIHSRTISELCQFGATFKDLFIPQPAELSDDSSDEGEDDRLPVSEHGPVLEPPNHQGRGRPSQPSNVDEKKADEKMSNESGTATPQFGTETPTQSHTPQPQEKRYGPRPTFWLDVLSPTETEMKILSKAFGIHQLTTEDIMMQEPREKVELFQNYYFVNYRSFEQDKDSDDYMEPVNIYVVVFRDGVLSFHFSMTPHPANVRRRIRQLNDYMSPTADWISYAVIDDVTDAYFPLVQQIEEEVDDIDDLILGMHSSDSEDEKPKKSSKNKDADEKGSKDARSEKGEATTGGDMLRRVGECRKKVMSLYRLLGNKADVIKGFAKRCNEQWDVAPRSEIGLYLGDIQDHIVTMTGNLSHYENLLSRAHSNYLAQINIRMNERAELTNDVLGKLTVLGTIVLPMNIITGMWGMNVWVPGQQYEGNLTWFWCITAGLVGFGLMCFFIAKRVYRIV